MDSQISKEFTEEARRNNLGSSSQSHGSDSNRKRGFLWEQTDSASIRSYNTSKLSQQTFEKWDLQTEREER